MESEILKSLLLINIVASSAIAFVLVTRDWIRRRFGAHATYALWVVVPIVVIACLLPVRQIVITQNSAFPSQMRTEHAATLLSNVAQLTKQDTKVANPMIAESTAWLSFAARSVLIVWLLGLILCLGLFAKRHRDFLRMLGNLEPHRALGRRIYLCRQNNIGPMTVGVLRPKVVLPANFRDQYNDDALELILVHEFAHIASGDTLVNFFAHTACCLCWFNPVVRFAAQRMRDDQEFARDADVIDKRPFERRRYAEALLRSQTPNSFPELSCAWSSKSPAPLKQRVRLLATLRHGSRTRRRRGAILISIIGLVFGTAAWSLQPPDIVFEPNAKLPAGQSNVSGDSDLSDDGDVVTYAVQSLEIRNTVANITVIPEDRNDIALLISDNSVLPEISVYIEASRLVVDGGIDLVRNPCREKYDDHIAVNIPTIGQLDSNALPTIIARVPLTVSLSTHGVVKTQIGPSFGGHVENHGCGLMTVGSVSGDLNVALFGHGDIETEGVTETVDAELFGTGNLTVGDGTKAKLHLLGTGNLVSGQFANSVTATLGGGGDITIAGAENGADLTLGGIGQIRVGTIGGHLDVVNSGAGQITIESIQITQAGALIHGTGGLAIKDGSSDEFDVTIYGEGDVLFDGVTKLLRADVSFAGGKVVVAHATNIQTTARVDRSLGDVRVQR